MSFYVNKAKKKTIQIHPRVVSREKECCECINFVENRDATNPLGWCSELKEPTLKYDECGAFTQKAE